MTLHVLIYNIIKKFQNCTVINCTIKKIKKYSNICQFKYCLEEFKKAISFKIVKNFSILNSNKYTKNIYDTFY